MYIYIYIYQASVSVLGTHQASASKLLRVVKGAQHGQQADSHAGREGGGGEVGWRARP